MSVTSIHQCRNLKAIVKYCTTPKSKQKGERVASLYSDFGNSDLFLKYADKILKNHRRKIQGYTLLQSFPKSEFDVHNQEHIAYVNELGRKLVYALYPNSPCLVITHADNDGECLHNHIVLINHNLQTDGCIRSNRHHKYVKKANDTLMKKYGLEVCKPSNQKLTQGEYWSNKRTNWLEQLKDSVDNALSHAATISEFHNNLLAEGITPTLYKANGELKERFTYTITDGNGKVHKKRSDRLGEGYSRQAIEQALLSNKHRREQQSIMSMSDWIELQKENERSEEPPQHTEAPPTPPIDILEINHKVSKKKTESHSIPEREMEKPMTSKSIPEKHSSQELNKAESLRKKRISIQNQILQLNKKFEDDSYTDADSQELKRLEAKATQIDIAIRQLEAIPLTNVKLDTSLLPQYQPDLSKDIGISL